MDRTEDTSGATTVEVRLPIGFRRIAGQATVKATGRTVRELIEELDRRYPGFRARLVDADGQLQQSMSIFVNGENVRHLALLDTPLAAGDRVHIVPPVAGG